MDDIAIFFDKFKSIGIDLENGTLDTTPGKVFIFDPSLEENKEHLYTNKNGVSIVLTWTKEVPTLDIHSVDNINAEDLFFSPPPAEESAYFEYLKKSMKNNQNGVPFKIREAEDIDDMDTLPIDDKRKAWESPYGYQRKSHKKR